MFGSPFTILFMDNDFSLVHGNRDGQNIDAILQLHLLSLWRGSDAGCVHGCKRNIPFCVIFTRAISLLSALFNSRQTDPLISYCLSFSVTVELFIRINPCLSGC